MIDVILPSLHTERLLLRLLTMDEAGAMFAYAADPAVARHRWTPLTSLDEATAVPDRVVARYAQQQPASWGVLERSSGHLMGTCSFAFMDPDGPTGRLGYAYARSFWGQGDGTEAARATVACGFNEMGFVRTEASGKADNRASAQTVRKLGIELVGTAPRFDAQRDRWWNGYAALRARSACTGRGYE